MELADFFCEDRDAFKLEECFKLFLGFCQRFRQGVMENEHRRQQEAAADARRKQREEQLALKRRQSSGMHDTTSTHKFNELPKGRKKEKTCFPLTNGFVCMCLCIQINTRTYRWATRRCRRRRFGQRDGFAPT